jgi:D-glycero-beta-D-manno-heptose 1-phosphate adenylyltransferase
VLSCTLEQREQKLSNLDFSHSEGVFKVLFDAVKDRANLLVHDYEKLAAVVRGLQDVNLTVVVTIGTYDMIHIGHCRYLRQAKSRGDVLIVGADSDAAVKRYKGPNRPMVPQDERLEMLLHTRFVDLVTIVDDVDEEGQWQFGLIKAVRPDVFVAVEDSYPEAQLQSIRQHCGMVDVLPRQAETSTSEVMRRNLLAQVQPLAVQLRSLADRIETGELQS